MEKMNELLEISERVYNVDIYNAMNEDATPANIAESIQADPLPVIEYLLDVIEDMQFCAGRR